MKDFEAAIEATIGPDVVLRDENAVEAFSRGWRDDFKSEPDAVLMPRSTAEVQSIVRICHEMKQPFVAQGGNTGVTGAGLCRPGNQDVLISLQKMNKVRSVDPRGNSIVVDSGCILADIHRTAAEHDRFFPLSLGSQGSCSIGGNISTNAGGINVLRYGNTRQLVSGLEVVLPDGRLWDGLRSLRKDNTGYDLKQLFIGAEGTLGIVTGAALTLTHSPRSSATLFVAVRSPEAALNWLLRLQDRFGPDLVACELIERRCFDVLFKHFNELVDPLEEQSPWYMLAELASPDPQANLTDRVMPSFEAAMEAGDLTDGLVSSSIAQSEKLWALREHIPEAHRREGLSFKHDVSVPVSKVAEFIDRAETELARRFPGIRQFAFGHIGDGNIHYNSLPPENYDLAEWAVRMPDVNEVVHNLVHELGGSISAEHGIGLLRREELPRYKSDVEMDLMKTIKSAIDPLNISNRGKIFEL